MPRHFRKCLEFSQLPKDFRKCLISSIPARASKVQLCLFALLGRLSRWHFRYREGSLAIRCIWRSDPCSWARDVPEGRGSHCWPRRSCTRWISALKKIIKMFKLLNLIDRSQMTSLIFWYFFLPFTLFSSKGPFKYYLILPFGTFLVTFCSNEFTAL